jgi:hypothetical protein
MYHKFLPMHLNNPIPNSDFLILSRINIISSVSGMAYYQIRMYCEEKSDTKNLILNHAQVLIFDHRRVQVPGEHRHRRLPPAKDGHGPGTHGLNAT